jgi:hypothetical protein
LTFIAGGIKNLRFLPNIAAVLSSVGAKLLEDIKLFMLSAPQGGNKGGTLSQNSAATYFSIVKAGLHRAFIDEYLTVDIAAKVKGIPDVKVKRETLTSKTFISMSENGVWIERQEPSLEPTPK